MTQFLAFLVEAQYLRTAEISPINARHDFIHINYDSAKTVWRNRSEMDRGAAMAVTASRLPMYS